MISKQCFVQEVFCMLSARGYLLHGPYWPPSGGVAFMASRKMPGGGEANVHLDLPLDLSDVRPFPETSMGRLGMKESGDVCVMIDNARRLAV